MKIKAVILLGLIVWPFILFSQSSFEFILEDSLSSKCYSTFIDNQDYYISVGYKGNIETNEYNSLILKYFGPDNIATKEFHKPDTSSYFAFGYLMNNGNYLMIGGIDNNINIYRKNLYVVELNQDLDVIKEKVYEIPEEYNSLSLHNLFIDSDSILIINGEVDDPEPGYIRHLYVAKLNMQGELLDTLITPEFRADGGSEILKKPDNSGYYLIGTFEYAELIELDNNINITGFQYLDPNNLYHGHLGVRWLSDGSIIIASLANQEVPGAFYDLRVRLCDTELEAFKDTVIFDDGKNFLPYLSGLDFIDENNIWVVTHSLGAKSSNQWEFGRIYIFDSELNVKGAKYFGGTLDKYLYSIKALDDGGCIITGTTPDSGNKGSKDIYIKKVMMSDIITHAEETPEINDRDVLLYPVPFNTELHIETYRKHLSFSLYSNSGDCVVFQEKLKIPNTTVETSNLNKGFYYYSIYDDGKIIQSGKLIKQ